jgi:hypothetical protein
MDWDKTKKIKKGPQQGLKGDKEKGKGVVFCSIHLTILAAF